MSIDSQQHPALRYAASALVLGVGLFGLLRVGWVEEHVLLPLTAAQGRVACALAGDPTAPIQIGLSCSGADVVALCAASILAFPAAFGRRLWGTALGLALIGALNTVRIGTLGRVADQRALFSLLHLYLWPGVLILAVTAYVVWWMRGATARDEGSAVSPAATGAALRFLAWALPLVGLYLFVSARLHEVAAVRQVTLWVAEAGAALLRLVGVTTQLDGSVLRIGSVAYMVTPECVTTPVLPLYLAAAAALPRSWRGRTLALLAALPVFFALAVGRLLALALPAGIVGSPFEAVHAFRQLLLAAALIVAAARWSADIRPAWPRAALAGLAAAVGVGWAGGAALGWLVAALAAGVPDPQGALRLAPACQLGLAAGLWLALDRPGRWRPAALAAAALLLQLAVGLLAAGALWRRDIPLHALIVRGWAIAAPLAIVGWLRWRARRAPAPRRDPLDPRP